MTSMKVPIKLIAVAAVLVFFANASRAHVPPGNAAPGSSCATAIIVPAINEISGVNYEYAYIRKHYPHSKFMDQALTSHAGKPYDVMTFLTADGKRHTLYFDISRYFGRH